MPISKDIPKVDAVVIGRNEGERLTACLASLRENVRRLIYVDSGSSDASLANARAMAAETVELDPRQPFTAARARNAGLRQLANDPPDYIQFIDGDCTLDPGWIPAALIAFRNHPGAVAICGRRRERHPMASIWNSMIDHEWQTPIGPALACGGDVLMRYQPLIACGGYRDALIAGEEPELCLRLRRAGGQIWRIDAEMTLHDAALHHWRQWWRRSVRAGHAFAEGAALHGHGIERHWVAETRRALIWGLGLPLLTLLTSLFLHPGSLALLLLYPAQIARLVFRDRRALADWPVRRRWQAAFFSTLGKFAEAEGAIGYAIARLRGRKADLIEYK
jgi:glycosyltransferase involved in cell wall biosynthesis